MGKVSAGSDVAVVETLDVRGQLQGIGVRAGAVSTYGEISLESLTARTLKHTGELSVRQLSGDKIVIDGRVTINELKSRTVELKGDGQIVSAALSESAELVGSYSLDRLITPGLNIRGRISCLELQADRANIKLDSEQPSLCGEVLADTLTIESVKSGSSIQIDKLTCKTCRAERLKAELIYSDTIYLGPGCKVKTLRYRQGYELHPEAKVEHVVKVI